MITTTIEKTILSKALSIASKAISANPIIPLLSNVLFESNNGSSRVAGTNFEIGISYAFPSSGEEFRTCLPAKTFTGLMEAIVADEIEIQLDVKDQSAIIMTDSSTSKIKCAPADEFPDIPTVTEPAFSMPVEQFKEMIQRVAFASSPTSEGLLSGVLLITEGDKLVMFATDGYHLSYEETELESLEYPLNVIMKGSTLEAISRILGDTGELQIQATENRIMFHCEQIDIIAQLLDGKFPDYKLLAAAVPTPTTKVIISTLELLQACRQLKVFAVDSGIARMEINGLLVHLAVVTQERGDSDVNLIAVKEGKNLSIGISVHFLYKFLEICKTGQVSIEFGGASSPILLRMDGVNSYYHVIMPIGL